jgi:enoyl-CoA hydratase/carnithine racemase
MELKTILYKKEDGMGKVRFNRPEARNALDLVMRGELEWILSDLKCDNDIRVVVLTGEGKSFCAGGDIKTMGGRESIIGGLEREIRIMRIFRDLAFLEKPVIAGVDGAATGAGLSLVLACDIVIAAERATFGAPFTRVGLVPDTGTTYFLPRVVGLAKAREMIVTGDLIDANEAYRIGLISKIVAHEELEDKVNSLAQRLSKAATKAIGMAKINLLKALDTDLRSVNLFESYGNALLFKSEDHKEGVDAFLSKRETRFKAE